MTPRVGRTLLSAAASNASAVNAAAHDDATAPLWFIFISLAVGSAARTALHGTSVPYTVVLFIIGMVMAVVYYYADLGLLEASLSAWGGINPHVLLACFLPALIFESSFSMEWHTLKKVLPKVLILAGPGVLMSMALTGCVLRVFPFDFSWAFCMMVGSILAATDPVAVVAILKEVGASKVLGHLIEGESLVNDGTAIVVFNVFLAIAKGEHLSFGDVMKDLITQPILSVITGVVIGELCLIWLRNSHKDHLVDITITLFAGYISFMLAEIVIKCSGVLAVVVLGWYLSAKGRTFFKGNIQHSMHHFWEVLTYAANTIVFILAGFLIVADILLGELDIKASDLGWGILLYLCLNIIRFVVTAMLFPWMNYYKGHVLSMRETFIAIWSGLRGAVGLALALVVLEDDAHFTKRERGLTLVMVSAAVIGTLLINASSAAAMLRIVGLLTPGLSHDRTLLAARKAIHERALAHYDEKLDQTGAQYLGAPDFTAVKQLVPFLRTQTDETEIEFKHEIAKMDAQLMHEMRDRFLAGLCKEVWSMLEDDLIDAKVAHGLLIACERATDKSKSNVLCTFDEFNRFMKQSRVKSAVVKAFERRAWGMRIIKTLRYLRLVEEGWMGTRRQMQGLHALISAHRLTSEQFKSLLGKNEEEEQAKEEAQSEVAELAKSYTLTKAGVGENLANETSIKSNHVRDVLFESDTEVVQAVEMLKEMQHAHNAVARSLRSEALAREILEVTMEETKLLTHTGLLDESEGSMLQAEHDLYLQRLIMHPLPPSRTSPGRILAAIPLFDFTQRVGIKSREIRKHFLREAEVVEFNVGDIIIDPNVKLNDGIMLVGNGVVLIESAADATQQITAGCKSHPHAWALALYEALANDANEEEPNRSGIRATAQTTMFGFVLPRSLLDSLRGDLREAETLEFMWRVVLGLLAETVLRSELDSVLPDLPVNKLVRAGKLVKISQGSKLEHDDRQVVILLRGSLYNDTCGNIPAPCVVTFKRTGMLSNATTSASSALESKLESRLSALKFGKNGLVRGSSQNLAALAAKMSVDESASESLPVEPDRDGYCTFESVNDLLIYVIPTDKLLQSPTSGKSRTSLRAQKKREFLRGLSNKVSRQRSIFIGPDNRLNAQKSTMPRRSIDSDRRSIEFDIESGVANATSRSPNRRLSLQLPRQPTVAEDADNPIGEDPRTQLTSNSMISLGTDDDNAQDTHRSDDLMPLRSRSRVWDDSPIPAPRVLPSRDYEDPSTQHTIS